MAYIGSSFPSANYGSKPQDNYLGNGVQDVFVMSQPVAGGGESNIDVYVDNVKQEPIYSYQVVQVLRITISGQFGDYTVNSEVTQSDNQATGIVVKHDIGSSIVYVYQTSEANFVQGGSALVQANSNGTFTSGTPAIITPLRYSGIKFSEAPATAQLIYIQHDGGSTYTLIPANESVTPEKLATNLRDFTVVTHTANAAETEFAIGRQELYASSLLVTVDGVVKTPIDTYVLSNDGLAVTFLTPMTGGELIEIRHLAFSTVSRQVVTETGMFDINLRIDDADTHIYALQQANYQLTGKMTTVNFNVRLVQKGIEIGYLYLGTLPHASYSADSQYFPLVVSNVTGFTGVPVVRIPPNSTIMELGQVNNVSGVYEQLEHQLLTNSSFFSGSFSYMNAK